MISTELFTEVYSEPYMLKAFPDKPSWIRWYANQFDVEHNIGVDINIYELAHKCKEWAYNEGYYLIEKVGSIEVYSGILMHIADSLDTPYSPNNTILACQWILDNRASYAD